MAIKVSDVYTTNANPASADYPQGSFKNSSGPGAGDGTPLDQQWANDLLGFFQALLAWVGVTPNGIPDTAIASQYLSALSGGVQALINAAISSEVTNRNSAIGAGDSVEAAARIAGDSAEASARNAAIAAKGLFVLNTPIEILYFNTNLSTSGWQSNLNPMAFSVYNSGQSLWAAYNAAVPAGAKSVLLKVFGMTEVDGALTADKAAYIKARVSPKAVVTPSDDHLTGICSVQVPTVVSASNKDYGLAWVNIGSDKEWKFAVGTQNMTIAELTGGTVVGFGIFRFMLAGYTL